MFWLEAEIQTKSSGLVQWDALQPATHRFDSFHPHNQFFMIFFFLPPALFPPTIRLCHFIWSLFPVLSGNNKFKIMTAVRVGARVVRKQEKGGFVISGSVSAIQCQQNTHNTYAALCTMSPRHQSRPWKGESKGGGGRGTEKQLRKTDWKKTQTPKLPVIVEMYGVITAGYLYLHRAADLCQCIRLFAHNKWTVSVIFTVKIRAVKKKGSICAAEAH